MIGTCPRCQNTKRILQPFFVIHDQQKHYIWLCLDCSADGWAQLFSGGPMRRLNPCSEDEIKKYLYYDERTHRFHKLPTE